jgi:hypothetical protein
MPITTTTTTARTRKQSMPVDGNTLVWRDKVTGEIARVTVWTMNHEGKDLVVEITGRTLATLIEQIKAS